MRHLLGIIILLLLVSCSGGGSGAAPSGGSTPPTPPIADEINISLNNTYIINGTVFTDDDLKITPFIISITNHSLSSSLNYDIVLTDNGFDWTMRTGTLSPAETQNITADLYMWMGGKTGTHNLEITVDWADIVTETDETDNNIQQTIFIIAPAGG